MLRDIKKFDDVYMMNDYDWATTPTGMQFKVERVHNDIYGNPMYHITFDWKTWLYVIEVPTKERKCGRLYKDKGYISFQSYNLSDTLKYLFNNMKLDHGLED